jgi:hypothetical protein
VLYLEAIFLAFINDLCLRTPYPPRWRLARRSFGLVSSHLPLFLVIAGADLEDPGSTYHGAGANTCTPGEDNDV